MRNIPSAYRRLLGVYGALGVLLWTVPLLSILHVESSAVVAAVSFFGAGLSTRSLLRQGFGLRRILLMEEAALLLPWLLLSISLLWQPNCGYVQGLLIYLIFPGATVLLAVGLMTCLQALEVGRSVLIFCTIGALVIIVPPIFDVGFHPQFYTYNHVFGGFLGPIYDDQLSMRHGLFAFRALTICWAVFFFSCSAILQKKSRAYPAVLSGFAIASCYAFAPALGIITTYENIQERLGEVRRTAHFDIYYDPGVVSEADIQVMAEDHEFRYSQLAGRLNESVHGRIQSYIYPDPDTKGRLTGARYTNVAPVWLGRPQVHVLQSVYDQIFTHELAHVFSREFGLPLIRASISVGLVEGLAVALEPPDGAPDSHEQVSAALLSASGGTREARSRSRDVSMSIADRLSPLGFWTARGAVSYTAMGSFVGFLLESYGAERFKMAYRWADFDGTYGKPVEDLAAEWVNELLNLEAVDPSSEALAHARFQIPSLFEKDCPHYVPSYQRMYEEAVEAVIHGDSARARTALDEAIQRQPTYQPALELWSGLTLAQGEPRSVTERLHGIEIDSLSALLLVRIGDANALLGRVNEAQRAYRQAIRRLPTYAQESRSRVVLRAAAAGHPNVLKLYFSGSDAKARSETYSRSADGPSSSARALLALRTAQDGNYEQALALMRTTSSGELASGPLVVSSEAARRRYVWLAHFAYRSGLLIDAAAYVDSAASAYRSVGAYNEAAAQDDFRDKINWLVMREMDQIARRNRPSASVRQLPNAVK